MQSIINHKVIRDASDTPENQKTSDMICQTIIFTQIMIRLSHPQQLVIVISGSISIEFLESGFVHIDQPESSDFRDRKIPACFR